MGLKNFILKKVLSSKMKGVPEDQIDEMIKKNRSQP